MDIDKLVNQVADLTDRNQHTAAVIEIAWYFNQVNTAQILTHVEQIAALVGSMPPELLKYRDALTREILEAITRDHGQEGADRIQGAL